MIVAALGVNRDRAAPALIENFQRVAFGAVVHAQHDDAAGLRPEGVWRAAAVCVGFEPRHIAMPTVGEKRMEATGSERDCAGVGYAARVEAFEGGPSSEVVV